MKTEEDNREVADFMGAKETAVFIRRQRGAINPYMELTLEGIGRIMYFNYRYECKDVSILEFHKNWNWLIPVVKKCYNTDKTLFYSSRILEFIFSNDIEGCWNSVLQFINNYYEVKGSNPS